MSLFLNWCSQKEGPFCCSELAAVWVLTPHSWVCSPLQWAVLAWQPDLGARRDCADISQTREEQWELDTQHYHSSGLNFVTLQQMKSVHLPFALAFLFFFFCTVGTKRSFSFEDVPLKRKGFKYFRSAHWSALPITNTCVFLVLIKRRKIRFVLYSLLLWFINSFQPYSLGIVQRHL